ncbi:uncharacterized protein METZ01_LOCUS257662, partial [marine metagenome]
MRISPSSTRPLQNKLAPLACLLLWQLAQPAAARGEGL